MLPIYRAELKSQLYRRGNKHELCFTMKQSSVLHLSGFRFFVLVNLYHWITVLLNCRTVICCPKHVWEIVGKEIEMLLIFIDIQQENKTLQIHNAVISALFYSVFSSTLDSEVTEIKNTTKEHHQLDTFGKDRTTPSVCERKYIETWQQAAQELQDHSSC